MKKLCKSISAISFLSLLVAGQALAGGPVARIDASSGKVFAHCSGMMKAVKTGDHIADFCELFTEEGAQVSFSDFYDHRFHLSGSGHVQLLNKMAELKSGYLWIQAPVNQGEYLLQSANSVVSFKEGEFIVSFEPSVGKTQLLNVRGHSEFSNSLDRMMNVSLSEGHFSYIQNEQNEGYPRKPTPIGFASFKKVTSLFRGVEPLDGRQGEEFKAVEADRGIASVQVEAPQVVMESKVDNEGKITILRKSDSAERAEKKQELVETYKEKMAKMLEQAKPKKFAPDYSKKSGVQIRVFGASAPVKKQSVRAVAQEKPMVVEAIKPKVDSSLRAPASVGAMAPEIKTGSKFENGMVDQYKSQMRHSQEVNNLIERLKSVDMDYQKSY